MGTSLCVGFFVFTGPAMDRTDILNSLKRRHRRWGIRAASDYVNSFAGCLGDGFCPTSLLGVSGEQWGKCLKDAAEALTYANPAMVTGSVTEMDVPDGGVMAFDCIITTTRRDRDGDILESSGASLDTKMPLLWQHLPLQPIGKFLAETGRTRKSVMGRFAIADTELGRDASALVKFGALRISHGFQPTEFEPLEDEKHQQIGWRIRTFDVLETSLVSIPSNLEAEILASASKSKAFAQELDGIRTAYGRNLLKTDLVKQWAKHIHDNRPTIVSVPKMYVSDDGTATPVDSTTMAEKHACACGKTIGEAVVKVSVDATELTDAIEQIKAANEKQLCTCPECGHRGPMSDFAGDHDDDDKTARIETLLFRHLLNDTSRMRVFRDRLTTVLEAHQSHRENAVDSGLCELLGLPQW